MGDLKVRNTLTKQFETFTPLKSGEAKIYVCGPTVWDFVHVGNMRPPTVFNMVRGWLEKKGYKVIHVTNYTDVDDKIINRANQEGVEPSVITEKYIKEYDYDFSRMGFRKPHHQPKVTDFMAPIIKIIGALIEEKKAYVVDGEVFYSVSSFDGYGKLSHKNIDELQVGIRVEIDSAKRSPLDFTLWKPAKPGEPKWPSPWGEGRPGWHIECSAMSLELLGEQFDIHGGGIDLIFPHHENEIAQTEGVTHKDMVKYWMHCNFINMGGEKMSKSLGNVRTARAFLDQYGAEVLKYMLLMAHYRSHSDFSESQIHNTVKQLARIYSALALCDRVLGKGVAGAVDPAFQKVMETAWSGIESAFDDDFNTPEVLARIFEVIRQFNTGYKLGQKVTPQIAWKAEQVKKFISETGAIMALFQEAPEAFLRKMDDFLLDQLGLQRSAVDARVSDRNAARAAKNFALSDEIRNELAAKGIAIQDTPEGTTWEVQK